MVQARHISSHDLQTNVKSLSNSMQHFSRNVIRQLCQSVEIETGGNHPFSYPSCKSPISLLTLLSAQQNETPYRTMLHSCQFKGIIIKHLAYLCYYFDSIINHFRSSRITCIDHLLKVF